MAARTPDSAAPLVSVLIAAHEASRTLPLAVTSILRQAVSNLELIVVDDASTDGTRELLKAIHDPRLVVIANEANLGLAGSLNRGLERARGRYIARLDADDVAMPQRLTRQLATLHERPGVAILGTAVLEIDATATPGTLHVPPIGDAAVRWCALFSSPVFHPTVMLDRHVLDQQGLRYDESLAESEDYDLWVRLLDHTRGDNIAEPLVLRRVHPEQASKRRQALQRELQLAVARRAISALAPALTAKQVELAWQIGSLGTLAADEVEGAVEAYLAVLTAFTARNRGARAAVRRIAARRLAVVARRDPGVWATVLRLDPLVAVGVTRDRRARRRVESVARPEARRWLASLESDGAAPVRVVVVSPEPTPYRSPLFDLVDVRPEVELTVVYQAHTVAGRVWEVEPRHQSVFLRGVRVPGLRRLLGHDYAVTPDAIGVLRDADPDVVIVSGWSTFASQAAVLWCRRRQLPYVLLVSSHDDGRSTGWRRQVREAIVGRVVGGASGALALGSLSRQGLVARGLDPERIGIFANTIDVESWSARADRLAAGRTGLREAIGASPVDAVILSVARLSREKELGDLVRAVALAGPSLMLVVAGSGPERESLERLARDTGVRLVLAGEVTADRLAELYVAADVFALLSSRETWGVVVNEAAATGLPLLLSDHVGAAPDLLEPGRNGELVAVGDVEAAAAALSRFATDEPWRLQAGAHSRAVVRRWGYGPSVESFVEVVREAARR